MKTVHRSRLKTSPEDAEIRYDRMRVQDAYNEEVPQANPKIYY
jgi:hypothetical protein